MQTARPERTVTAEQEPRKEIPRVDVRMSAEERRRRIREGIALIMEQDAEILAELAR